MSEYKIKNFQNLLNVWMYIFLISSIFIYKMFLSRIDYIFLYLISLETTCCFLFIKYLETEKNGQNFQNLSTIFYSCYYNLTSSSRTFLSKVNKHCEIHLTQEKKEEETLPPPPLLENSRPVLGAILAGSSRNEHLENFAQT